MEILQRKGKRQQFSAWISFWLNPLIILGFPERESEMERYVLFSNNSYLHPFLPLHCCVVVGRTPALFLGEPLRLKLFYAPAPRAPIWELLYVSFHTLLSSSRVFAFNFILWGVLCFVINGSRNDDMIVSALKFMKVLLVVCVWGLNLFWWKTVLTRSAAFYKGTLSMSFKWLYYYMEGQTTILQHCRSHAGYV